MKTTEGESLKQGMESKSKDSSRRKASEKDFMEQNATGQDCGRSRSQFVEKGTEVYAKALIFAEVLRCPS